MGESWKMPCRSGYCCFVLWLEVFLLVASRNKKKTTAIAQNVTVTIFHFSQTRRFFSLFIQIREKLLLYILLISFPTLRNFSGHIPFRANQSLGFRWQTRFCCYTCCVSAMHNNKANCFSWIFFQR